MQCDASDAMCRRITDLPEPVLCTHKTDEYDQLMEKYMAEIVTVTEDEAAKLALEGDAIILGGVEVHVRFVRHMGNPGIQIEYTPPFGPDDCPDWMVDINNRISGLCRATVMTMNDHARKHLLDLVEHDGGNDRMIYRLFVTSRIEDDGSRDKQVHDFIDPDFLRVDAGIAKRARDARKEIERVLGIKESQ